MGPPHVRFYCGAPLISSEGQVLGSLAVLDIKPRTMPAGASRRTALCVVLWRAVL